MRTVRITTLAYMLAVYNLVFGLFLVLPFDTFTSSPSFALIAGIIPEAALGALLIAFALSVAGCVRRNQIYVARAALGALAALWAGLAFLFFLSNPTATAWLTYGGLAHATAFVFWRLR